MFRAVYADAVLPGVAEPAVVALVLAPRFAQVADGESAGVELAAACLQTSLYACMLNRYRYSYGASIPSRRVKDDEEQGQCICCYPTAEGTTVLGRQMQPQRRSPCEPWLGNYPVCSSGSMDLADEQT